MPQQAADEVRRILQMLAEHKINAEQAERLLDALGVEQPTPEAEAEEARGNLGEIFRTMFQHGFAGHGREPAPSCGEARGRQYREERFLLTPDAEIDVRATAGNLSVKQQDGLTMGSAVCSGGTLSVDHHDNLYRVTARHGRLELLLPPLPALRASVHAGSVELTGISAEMLVRLTGGNLTASGLSGRLEAKVFGGNVRIDDGLPGLDVRAHGGNVRIRGLRLVEGKHCVRGLGGNTELTLASDASVTVSVSAPGGNSAVDSDRLHKEEDPERPGRWLYRLNEGAATLDVRAAGGNVSVRVAD